MNNAPEKELQQPYQLEEVGSTTVPGKRPCSLQSEFWKAPWVFQRPEGQGSSQVTGCLVPQVGDETSVISAYWKVLSRSLISLSEN